MNKFANFLDCSWFLSLIGAVSLDNISQILGIVLLVISVLSGIVSLIIRVREMLKDKHIDEDEKKEIVDSVIVLKEQVEEIIDEVKELKDGKKGGKKRWI